MENAHLRLGLLKCVRITERATASIIPWGDACHKSRRVAQRWL